MEGWPRAEVQLKAKIKGGHDLDIDVETDRIEIEMDFSFFSLFRGVRAKLELKVPVGAEVEIDETVESLLEFIRSSERGVVK